MTESRDRVPERRDAPLTPEERHRLRPTVDAAALERFLTAEPDLPRIAVIAHFATEVRLEDLLALMRSSCEAGTVTAGELEDYERTMREPWPADTPPQEALYVVQVPRPTERRLRMLWDAIEPCPA